MISKLIKLWIKRILVTQNIFSDYKNNHEKNHENNSSNERKYNRGNRSKHMLLLPANAFKFKYYATLSEKMPLGFYIII